MKKLFIAALIFPLLTHTAWIPREPRNTDEIKRNCRVAQYFHGSLIALFPNNRFVRFACFSAICALEVRHRTLSKKNWYD